MLYPIPFIEIKGQIITTFPILRRGHLIWIYRLSQNTLVSLFKDENNGIRHKNPIQIDWIQCHLNEFAINKWKVNEYS